MGRTTASDFAILEWADYRFGPKLRLIEIDSNRIDDCMRHYVEAELDGIYISPVGGYRLKRLTFLRDYPFIRRVVITYAPNIRLSDLSVLKDLRCLTIADNKEPIDFSCFGKLQNLSVDWHPKMMFPVASTAMKRLALRCYKPKSKDFRGLPDYVNLERLEVVRSPIDSLAGLGRFEKLTYLELDYLTKLERIGDLDVRSLQTLEFNVCRKISDHAHVATLPSVRVLRLNDCGEVPSLGFLDRMPQLEEFAFVDTNVLDGDLTPCLRLKRIGFLNRKHYSHTSEQVETIVSTRRK